MRLAREAIEAGDDSRAWSVLGVVAHFRGDFDAAREGWLRAAAVPSDDEASFVGSATLASAYDGDSTSARTLLDRARGAAFCGSHRAFLAYVEGEMRPAKEAIPHYATAIAEASSVGCTFIAGVARVSLASAQARAGDVTGAAEGFGYLIEFWRRTGQATQLWTTARNAAELLGSGGRSETAALLLIAADAEPGAAAVSSATSRHSGRAFLRLEDLPDVRSLEEPHAEASGWVVPVSWTAPWVSWRAWSPTPLAEPPLCPGVPRCAPVCPGVPRVPITARAWRCSLA